MLQTLRRIKRWLRPPGKSDPVQTKYLTSPPSDQNAIDIFAGEWVSRFPGDRANLQAGNLPLFEVPLVESWVGQLGGVAGKSVLELGPLEGGHSYMLEKHGAASIDAIEANTRMYLRCLVLKEILGLTRCRFQCGDFVGYLRNCKKRFDVCLACGVLYHMRDPVSLLSLISKVTDQLCLWTHYYDPTVIHSGHPSANNFSQHIECQELGIRVILHRHEYGQAFTIGWRKFYGGNADHSHWMERADLLACLSHFGFDNVEITREDRDHPHGPAIGLVARRSKRS
jgi:hypothetical protein